MAARRKRVKNNTPEQKAVVARVPAVQLTGFLASLPIRAVRAAPVIPAVLAVPAVAATVRAVAPPELAAVPPTEELTFASTVTNSHPWPITRNHAFKVDLATRDGEQDVVQFQECDFGKAGRVRAGITQSLEFQCGRSDTSISIRRLTAMPAGWILGNEIGHGSFGKVFDVTHVGDSTVQRATGAVFVAKQISFGVRDAKTGNYVQRNKGLKEFIAEAAMLSALQETGLVPTLEDAFIYFPQNPALQPKGYIVMEKFRHAFVNLLIASSRGTDIRRWLAPGWGKTLLQTILSLSKDHGLFWTEATPREVFVVAKGKFKFVDLSPNYWTHFKLNPITNYIQTLLFTSNLVSQSCVWHKELDVLRRALHSFLTTSYGGDLFALCSDMALFDRGFVERTGEYSVEHVWIWYSANQGSHRTTKPTGFVHQRIDIADLHFSKSPATVNAYTQKLMEFQITEEILQRVLKTRDTTLFAASRAGKLPASMTRQLQQHHAHASSFIVLHWKLMHKLASLQNLNPAILENGFAWADDSWMKAPTYVISHF